MTLYEDSDCEVVADENLTLMASSFNKNHLLKLQHYTIYTLPANEIV
jgi:hypothetical protein